MKTRQYTFTVNNESIVLKCHPRFVWMLARFILLLSDKADSIKFSDGIGTYVLKSNIGRNSQQDSLRKR